ncbi:batten's disease protein Cln3 [Ilyonectria sp. MPI-CAGE-AT-0026]|nr:batten's disease protein Cln3 [Ilyonectria sp. MPI-CAGE-AT-0026]
MIPPRSRCCGTTLPSYLGFAILGLVNTVVPFIVFSANYLIIPYPRWVVILIETLPALITKLVVPHFLHHVPYWMRPLTAGACWILVAVVTNVTPPNVAPPSRIFTTVLAASAAAAMEVSFLGMTRYYGKAGLAGWGAGVGAGAVFCAVLPFVLTVWMEAFLRTFIDLIYVLTGAMLVGFFAILPGAPVNYPDTQRKRSKDDIEDGPEGAFFLMFDPLEELTRLLSTENRVALIKAVVRPYMVPLFIAFATQTLIFPGISRALPVSPAFETFFSYFTTYGFAFQLGGFVSRTLTPLFRARSTKAPFTILGLAAAVVLINATFSLFSSPVLIGLLAFCAGLMGGAIYMIVMGNVLEDKTSEPGINQEFCLQAVGAGETAGTMVGGLLGSILEASFCKWDIGAGATHRWCQTSR